MPHPLDNRLILNRQALGKLGLAGWKKLAEGLPDIHAARNFALWHQSSGAETYLLSLLTAATRATALRYFEELRTDPGLKKISLAGKRHPLPELEIAYRSFLDCYPRAELENAKQPGATKAQAESRQKVIAELFTLDALLANQATGPFQDLFDDTELTQRFDYRHLMAQITSLSIGLHEQDTWRQSLPELLRAPTLASPHSLEGQLSYIFQYWRPWLPEELIMDMQMACAIAAEEKQSRLPGPGPAPTPLFGAGDGSEAPAAFTADIDWMPNAILLAKSVYVWLDQLSLRYQRTITTLADIPDEELACLARWGFNALWLIGIWERSEASRRIKQLSGNPEAEASAYALHAYRVAYDLGGEDALHNLQSRCLHYGIRLACDVVPNHTGIDSEWVRQHPDWFLQTEHPPYPAYRFSGPDLCNADETSIRIEDGYWDHSDAAVVCEHHDHRTGLRRYIYHGNDGTHMPWNDTAQLNFLLPEVRQAMSDLIIAIAKRFSLIRFDAAMTLARKHFRRLWFPPPGGSAGVPSRSSFWMSDADFEKAFPVEFWREVVDRINREAPDTLLIAEAFWLMESYFVRNLGMHRVYNSAFMNLLKREENAKYRKIIKDTLAYNPEILKRYVNFMNNPDEATAVEQFDKGDKYFGVATLLVTLPGLPMFGHGQVEGFREKYGMEYRRAYWAETPDTGFVAHHERQIFPLLRKRHIFAGVENFSFYDFTTDQGVDENVFAFSNGPATDKFLIVYNNSAHDTVGKLHHTAPKASAAHEGSAQPMPPLWQDLGLDSANGQFCRFRNLQGAEQFVPAEQLRHGFHLQLGSYGHQVFHDFQLFNDPQGCWQKLHQQLQGRPVENLDRELLKMLHQPLWQAFTELLDFSRLHALAGGLTAAPQSAPIKKLMTELDKALQKFAADFSSAAGLQNQQLHPTGLKRSLAALSKWLDQCSTRKLPEKLLVDSWLGTRSQPALGTPLLTWLLLQSLRKALGLAGSTLLIESLEYFGLHYAWQESAFSIEQQRTIVLTRRLLQTEERSPHPATCEVTFAELCLAPENAGLLGINLHAGERWFLQEGITALAGGLALQAVVSQLLSKQKGATFAPLETSIAAQLRQRLARAAAVGYRLDKFLHLG